VNTFYAILILVGLFGVIWVFRKIGEATSKAVNQKILYRSEYKEGLHVSAPVKIVTSVPAPDIMNALTAHVTVADHKTAYKAVVWEVSRTATAISYAYGNRFVPASFEAAVMLTDQAGSTEWVFAVLRWTEGDGLIAGQDAMKKLRKQVLAAFTAVDPAARITEGSAV
jgi:hypothetical protein